MRTLVTGGAGFIGSHLVDLLLSEGHEVTVLDDLSTGRRENLPPGKNPRVIFRNVDLSRSGDLARHFRGVRWVFHLAALADIVPSIERPIDYYRANVTGTIAVLEAARMAKVARFVYSASSSCYGIPDAYPTLETSAIRPQYPYALTKRLGEEAALHWAQVYGLPVVSLRLFNVYGPRSRTSGTYGAVFGVFLAQKLAGKPFTVVGDGTQTRDFVFVKDVARAFLAAAKSDKSGEVYNVGAGSPVSVLRLVELLKGPATHLPKRPGEPDRTHADISRIRRDLGWSPEMPIERGVQAMLDSIDYWRKAPVWTPASIKKATKAWFKHLG
ncbi:MAG: SDR family oxidoreductase [Elusimicrobia bacterium]|nr:SDR family oxidoreductase [Elusimicrobiota bacterium]